MSLSPGSTLSGAEPTVLVVAAVLAYVLAALPLHKAPRLSSAALLLGWVAHLALLIFDISGWGQNLPGTRLGFAPVLSATVWLLLAVHAVESRFVPLPAVRIGLASAGALAVIVAAIYPGEVRQFATPLGPLHFVLGVASYGLFGAAVLHALMLDAAERRLKRHKGVAGAQAAAATGTADVPFRAGRFCGAHRHLAAWSAGAARLALGPQEHLLAARLVRDRRFAGRPPLARLARPLRHALALCRCPVVAVGLCRIALRA